MGDFFFKTGFILLPVNDRDDSRKHLTIQEYHISKSTQATETTAATPQWQKQQQKGYHATGVRI